MFINGPVDFAFIIIKILCMKIYHIPDTLYYFMSVCKHAQFYTQVDYEGLPLETGVDILYKTKPCKEKYFCKRDCVEATFARDAYL